MSPSSVKSCRIVFNLPNMQSRSFPKTKKMLFKAAQKLEQKMALYQGCFYAGCFRKVLLSGDAFPPAAHCTKPPSSDGALAELSCSEVETQLLSYISGGSDDWSL